MRLVFAEGAWQDYLYWQKQDRRMVERINLVIRHRKARAVEARTGRVLVTPNNR